MKCILAVKYSSEFGNIFVSNVAKATSIHLILTYTVKMCLKKITGDFYRLMVVVDASAPEEIR